MPGKPTRKKAGDGQSGTEAVDAFMRDLAHKLKPEAEALRKIILAADSRIGEGIKWNAPSFHLKEHFATFNLHAPELVRVVLHRGARAREHAVAIDDPGGQLEWHAKDRCSAKFADMKSIKRGAAAFQEIIRQWIKLM